MNFELIHTYPFVAHTEYDCWTPTHIGYGKWLLPQFDDNPLGNTAIQVYDNNSLNDTQGDPYFDTKRPMRIDLVPVWLWGLYITCVTLHNHMMIMGRWNNQNYAIGNWNGSRIDGSFNYYGQIQIPGLNCLAMSPMLNGHYQLISMMNNNRIAGVIWDFKTMTAHWDGRIFFILPSNYHAGSVIPFRDNLLFLTMVQIGGTPVQRLQCYNNISVYRYSIPNNTFTFVEAIDVSGLCEGGSDGIFSAMYDGVHWFLFECGRSYTPPYESPVAMHHCKLVEP